MPTLQLSDYEGVNGAVLFVVKGKEKWKVNSVVSWFSGEE